MASARREERLQQVSSECREYTLDSFYIAGDISDKAFAQDLIDQTVARFGRVDILVNNAAVPMHPLELMLQTTSPSVR